MMTVTDPGRGRSPVAERKTLVAVVVAAYLAFLGIFGYLAADVQYFPGELDFSTWVQSWRTAWLDSVMKVVSTPGLVLVPLAVFASTFLFITGRRKEAVLILATLLVASVLTFAVKWVVARPRPSGELVQILVDAEGRSFPSGHVLRYASFFGVVGLVSTWNMGPSVVRSIIYGALALAMMAIGLSRIYLGVHWLGDVVGGYAFGAALVMAVAGVRQWWVVGVGRGRGGSVEDGGRDDGGTAAHSR